MSRIIVSPLSQLANQIEQHKPANIVTLTSAEIVPIEIETNRLILTFHDITEPREGLVSPEEHHVKQLLQFVQQWDRLTPLLIHCYAGISRSTAAAYIAALALNPDIDETALALQLRRLSPSATPNIRLVTLADQILSRKGRSEGRMVAAIRAIGRGADAFEGEVFSLPV